MSLTVLALVSLPVLCMQTPSTAPTQAAPLPKAEDVLAKLEAAIGDAAARAKAKNVAVTGTFSMAMMPMPGKFEEAYAGERVKWSIDVPGMGSMTQGSTDTYSWTTDPAVGIVIKLGDERAPVQRQYGVHRRAAWNTMFASATTVKRLQLDGRDVLELDMAPKKGAHDTWFVDAATFALAAVDTRLPDPQGGELPIRFEFSDWRQVDGVAYAFARKMKVGTYVIDYKVERLEHKDKIDEARLAPPEDVVAAFKDPVRRATIAPEKGGECTRTKLEAQPVATVRTTCKTKDIATTLSSILPEVMEHLTKVGASMTGPPFSRYHSIDADTVDIEAGFPVKKAIKDAGRIKASELPAGEVAVTWHFGPYEELDKSHALLEAWMKSQSLESGGGMWEIYWTDPGIEPDPKKWRTQLLWPIKKK